MTLFQDVTLGRYLPGDSPVHRLDPRAKILACLLVLAGSFVSGSGWGVVACWPLLAYGVHASKVPVTTFLRGLKPFGWLLAFTVAVHGLTTPGTTVGIFPLLTWEGVTRGSALAAQLATAIGYSSLLTLTTDPAELVWGMERLLSPLGWLGVPVEEFCFTLLMALHFFPILHEEVETLSARQEGNKPRGLMARARYAARLVAPLFRNALARAETVGLELETRTLARRPVQRFRTPEWAILSLGVATLLWVGFVATSGGVS